MDIIVDIGGCDTPDKMIGGALVAAKQHPDYRIVVVGDGALIEKYPEIGSASNLVIEHAPDVITNDDSPTHAIRQKPNSSLVKSIDILKASDNAIGLVSGGSTGAVLTAATLLIGRMKGVLRPVLASPGMPTAVDGKAVCVADCGANVDSKPEYLAQFALMASAYVKAVFGVENPAVGLLSVGTENKKGDERTKAAFELIKDLPINFVGNMEARYALTGDYDVIVSDGFAGNVLIKSIEGTAKMVMGQVKGAIKSSTRSKIGALFMKKELKGLKSKMDYHVYGGAAFLGVNKLVVKTHGSSNEVSTAASINNVIKMHEHDLIGEINRAVADYNASVETANA